ncbi:uncharacterized protein LOC101862047 [Aplysia californica]|uniref:Uncharacterized protein LOC101862047 n=1 Tax=Aplysia californica TaxID=6500 RepID=A0ABM0JU68_APLCA|nr:uncharacterized protein LOC101862047 [Aplysia californica]
MRWQLSFWQQRRHGKTSGHRESSRQRRDDSMAYLNPGPRPGVNFEVENFRVYGHLRRAHTEVKNSLPTHTTIQTEKSLMCFEEQRRISPDAADYTTFYRCLSASVSAPVSANPSQRAPGPSRISVAPPSQDRPVEAPPPVNPPL